MSATTELQGLVRALDEQTYHAHEGSLSSTGAKTLLKSPRLYQHRLTAPFETTPAMDLGTVVHTLVLGVGAQPHVIDAASLRGKAAEAEAAEARAAGEVPIIAKDYATAEAMAAAVRAHPAASRLLEVAADREMSLFAPDEATGTVRRGRVDALAPRYAIDLKTARDASPATWSRTVASSGYDLQAAWYLDLLADVGHAAEAFLWIAVEKEPPYLVGVHKASADVLDDGRALARHALDLHRRYTDAGIWPDFPGDDIASTQAAAWRGRDIETLITETS